MNALTVPFFSAVALASMTGAVAHHWLDVRAQVTGQLPAPPIVHETALPAPDLLPSPAETPVAPASGGIDSALAAQLSRVIAGQEEIMARFAELDRRNVDLRDQVAETNRDLMELQFRVDSHSESFRPLRATQANARVLDSGLLPPRE